VLPSGPASQLFGVGGFVLKSGFAVLMLVLQVFFTVGVIVTGVIGTYTIPQVHFDGAPGIAAGTHG
jgi:hypothetical protein